MSGRDWFGRDFFSINMCQLIFWSGFCLPQAEIFGISDRLIAVSPLFYELSSNQTAINSEKDRQAEKMNQLIFLE